MEQLQAVKQLQIYEISLYIYQAAEQLQTVKQFQGYGINLYIYQAVE